MRYLSHLLVSDWRHRVRSLRFASIDCMVNMKLKTTLHRQDRRHREEDEEEKKKN